jgi:hypothetical protein
MISYILDDSTLQICRVQGCLILKKEVVQLPKRIVRLCFSANCKRSRSLGPRVAVDGKVFENDTEVCVLFRRKKLRPFIKSLTEGTFEVTELYDGDRSRSSRLGTLLADRFSESLTAYSAGLNILDRKILKNYLTTNWTTVPAENAIRRECL